MSEFNESRGAFLVVTATDVTGAVEREAEIPNDLSGLDAARAIAALLLREPGDWILREHTTGASVRDQDRVGNVISPGATVTLTTRAHLGSA